ncbi:hypothetical protein R3P38DRAFT_3471843 [Favolaschia claudopus]|uniref:Uncharacterized protein n=1 Tax=Favolaschia claudopus TaxID=2862362 RepID=A0AAV9ZCA2_9AGAR
MSVCTYLTTVYAVQVEKARERVDVAKNADMFAATLTEYCVRIITLAGDPDTTAWQPCVSAVKATLTEQLKGTRFEFTARLDRDATTKEANAQAVLTARADAEMVDANRPIEEIIAEKVDTAVVTKLASLAKESKEPEKKKQRPAPAASTSTQTTNTKPKQKVAKASSSKDSSKPLKQTKLDLQKKEKPAQEKKKGTSGKHASGNDAGEKSKKDSVSKGKSSGKAKAPAKAADPETTGESDNDDSD